MNRRHQFSDGTVHTTYSSSKQSSGTQVLDRDPQLARVNKTNQPLTTCSVCKKEFKTQSSLRRHYLEQHGERTGNSEICVDPVKGIYFVYSAERTGTAFPVHVQKKTVGKSRNIQCEVEGCMSGHKP